MTQDATWVPLKRTTVAGLEVDIQVGTSTGKFATTIEGDHVVADSLADLFKKIERISSQERTLRLKSKGFPAVFFNKYENDLYRVSFRGISGTSGDFLITDSQGQKASFRRWVHPHIFRPEDVTEDMERIAHEISLLKVRARNLQEQIVAKVAALKRSIGDGESFSVDYHTSEEDVINYLKGEGQTEGASTEASPQ